MHDHEPLGPAEHLPEYTPGATPSVESPAGASETGTSAGLSVSLDGRPAFWARIVGQDPSIDRDRYSWVEVEVGPDGAVTDLEGGLSGVYDGEGAGFALEASGFRGVPVGTPATDEAPSFGGEVVWLRQSDAGDSWLFSAGQPAGGQTIEYYETTHNYYDSTLNYYGLTINVVENDFTININEGNTFYVYGPGDLIIEAPLEVCGWMYWCWTDHTINSLEDDWPIPGTPDDGEGNDHGESVVYRLALAGSSTITGMTSAHNGQVCVLVNTSDAHDLTLTHQDAGSLSSNRFDLEDAEDVTVGPGGMRLCWYDGESARWRVHAGGTGGGGGASPTATNGQAVGSLTNLSTSWSDVTDAEADLPGAGTYLITATGAALASIGASGTITLSVRLYGSTLTPTTLAGSEHEVIDVDAAFDPTGRDVGAFSISVIVAVAAAATVKLQGVLSSGSGNGQVTTSTVAYVKLA